MSRKVGKWFCVKCHHQSVDAHLPALNDYKLLISNRISNRGARDFLQVGSPYIVKYILQKGGFAYIGKTNARMYEIPEQNAMNPE